MSRDYPTGGGKAHQQLGPGTLFEKDGEKGYRQASS